MTGGIVCLHPAEAVSAAMFATIAHLWRLSRVGFVLAREGAFGMVDPAMVPVAARLCRSGSRGWSSAGG